MMGLKRIIVLCLFSVIAVIGVHASQSVGPSVESIERTYKVYEGGLNTLRNTVVQWESYALQGTIDQQGNITIEQVTHESGELPVSVPATDPDEVDRAMALSGAQQSKSARNDVDSLWLDGDVTQVPDVTVFNNWFNVHKTDIKKMEEGLTYWGPKNWYFEWQIRTQISQLTHSPQFAGSVISEYELQKSKSDLERSSKQAQERARKELRDAEVKKQQQQERNKNLKRWLISGVTTAAVVAAIIGCIWWMKKPAAAH